MKWQTFLKEEGRTIVMTTEERKVRDFGLIFYLWFLVVLAAYAFGVYAIYDFIISGQGAIDWIVGKAQGLNLSELESYVIANPTIKNWIFGGIAILFVLGIIIAFIEVWFMSYFGAEIVTGTIFGMPLLLIGAGVFSLIWFDQKWIGAAMLVPAAFLIVIVLLVARRVVLGAKIFETSCEAVNENKRTLLPILFFAIMSIITFALGTSASVWVGLNIGNILSESSKWVQMLVFFVVIYVFLAIYWTTLYFTDAINICIYKRWNNYKDASIRIAIREIWKIKGSIVLFGMFMAFFDWLIKIVQYFAAKKIKETSRFFKFWSIAKKVLYVIFFIFIILLRWLFKILKFLNYYTLTIIVVEKQGFIKSIVRSSDLALDSGADIIIGKTGVGIAKGLFSAMTLSIFAVGGFFAGYYWLGLEITGSLTDVAMFGVAVAILFFFFGYLPMTAILRPISTAYKTILFYYITDPFRGKPGRRTRLSKDIQESVTKVRERVMETYDKEDRPTWTKPEESVS